MNFVDFSYMIFWVQNVPIPPSFIQLTNTAICTNNIRVFNINYAVLITQEKVHEIDNG